ncbi:hypothetical protein K502DRAFT_341229 [Neoconidiobolus thromboides FSU 785]|nr:hypothetical protein K502DRAFT_341229 [Neoconidiobolus thromboides FSU 785]
MEAKTSECINKGIDLLFKTKDQIDNESFDELLDTLTLLGWKDLPEIKKLFSNNVKEYEQILELTKGDQTLSFGLQQMCESFELLEDIYEAVEKDPHYLKLFINSLQFDHLETTHSEVMKELENVLNQIPSIYSSKIKLILLERAIMNDMAFSKKELNDALSILKNKALYIEVLNQLYRQSLDNLSWENTFESVMAIVYSMNPEVAEIFEMFLWYTHAIHTYKDPSTWYATYCEYMFNPSYDGLPIESDGSSISAQLSKLNLEPLGSPKV